ncbi:MAG: sigma-54-dependent Fis family transcriptional regulator [Planctomycetota bacterium]|nr:sigma-54-dependent Fis family transcriptional regulator [Planctomycetota bacterium]
MPKSLPRSSERFDKFLDICRNCAQIAKTEEFTAKLCDDMLRLFSADYATILLREGESWNAFDPDSGEFVKRTSRIPVPRSIINAACEKGDGVLMEEPGSEERFRNRASISRNEIATAAAVPFGDDEPAGVLYIHRNDPAQAFTEEDFRVLFALSMPVKGAFSTIEQYDKVNSERDRLRKVVAGEGKLVGRHSSMKSLDKMIQKVAPLDSTVLVTGETGTGKELVARALHERSSRANGPFVPVNCAAISESLVESELFGHEKGAFTGATQTRIGAFEAADGGSVFLDEIGELSPNVQAKLLRVLEDRLVKKVGGNVSKKVDVRLIAATNRDLEKLAGEGVFRSDLFFRVSVVKLELPRLAERVSDIPLLCKHFMEQFSRKLGIRKMDISPAAMNALKEYDWPGNVRELRNVLERSAILADGAVIEAQRLALPTAPKPESPGRLPDFAAMSAEEVEKMHIGAVLDSTNGNKSLAAEVLGIDRSTLYSKCKKYAL